MTLSEYLRGFEPNLVVQTDWLSHHLVRMTEIERPAVEASISVSCWGRRRRLTLVRPEGSELCLFHLGSESGRSRRRKTSGLIALLFSRRMLFSYVQHIKSEFNDESTPLAILQFYDRVAKGISTSTMPSGLSDGSPSDKSLFNYIGAKKIDPCVEEASFDEFKSLADQLKKPCRLKSLTVVVNSSRFTINLLRPMQSRIALYHALTKSWELEEPKLFFGPESLRIYAREMAPLLGTNIEEFEGRVMDAYAEAELLPDSKELDI